jgi:hypothetical protein
MRCTPGKVISWSLRELLGGTMSSSSPSEIIIVVNSHAFGDFSPYCVQRSFCRGVNFPRGFICVHRSLRPRVMRMGCGEVVENDSGGGSGSRSLLGS